MYESHHAFAHQVAIDVTDRMMTEAQQCVERHQQQQHHAHQIAVSTTHFVIVEALQCVTQSLQQHFNRQHIHHVAVDVTNHVMIDSQQCTNKHLQQHNEQEYAHQVAVDTANRLITEAQQRAKLCMQHQSERHRLESQGEHTSIKIEIIPQETGYVYEETSPLDLAPREGEFNAVSTYSLQIVSMLAAQISTAAIDVALEWCHKMCRTSPSDFLRREMAIDIATKTVNIALEHCVEGELALGNDSATRGFENFQEPPENNDFPSHSRKIPPQIEPLDAISVDPTMRTIPRLSMELINTPFTTCITTSTLQLAVQNATNSELLVACSHVAQCFITDLLKPIPCEPTGTEIQQTTAIDPSPTHGMPDMTRDNLKIQNSQIAVNDCVTPAHSSLTAVSEKATFPPNLSMPPHGSSAVVSSEHLTNSGSADPTSVNATSTQSFPRDEQDTEHSEASMPTVLSSDEVSSTPDIVTGIKSSTPFMKSVHSSPLQEPSTDPIKPSTLPSKNSYKRPSHSSGTTPRNGAPSYGKTNTTVSSKPISSHVAVRDGLDTIHLSPHVATNASLRAVLHPIPLAEIKTRRGPRSHTMSQPAPSTAGKISQQFHLVQLAHAQTQTQPDEQEQGKNFPSGQTLGQDVLKKIDRAKKMYLPRRQNHSLHPVQRGQPSSELQPPDTTNSSLTQSRSPSPTRAAMPSLPPTKKRALVSAVDRPERLGLLNKPKKRSGYCQQCGFEGRYCKISDCLKHQMLK